MPLALALLALAADGPADFIWLEGEAATAKAPLTVAGWGHVEYLSGRKWLAATGPTAEATATWPLSVPAAGRYDVWLRVGFAGDFSPFRWRMVGRAWVDVPGDAAPHDLMAVDDATLVGWVKAGSIDLAGGQHTLEVNVPRPAAGPLRFALDAACLIRGPFLHDGPNRPGTVSRAAIDVEAAGRGFEFPPPPPGTAPHARRVLELAGTWQAARWDELAIADRAAPVAELPADLSARPWRGVRVPGDLADARPEWAYCHRFLLRTRFTLTADLAGRSLTLRLPSACLSASVFVNGKPVGTTAAPYAPLVCDLGPAAKPGSNDLVVAIKDAFYAVAETPWAKLRLLPPDRFASSDLTRTLDWPVRTGRRGGLLEPPSLTVAGPVFVADMFARPQVAAGRLVLEVTVRNPSTTPRTVEVRPVVRPMEADGRVIGGPAAKAFVPKPVTVPAGGEAMVSFDEPWPNPRLWWPDDPVRYVVETTLALDGRPADEQTTRFGFREWDFDGSRVTLNGVPWKLTADARPPPLSLPAVKGWRATGASAVRYVGERPLAGATQADTLAAFDAAGVPVLRAGPGDDGTVANRQAQFLARVRAERNSPAVAAWELPAGVEAAAVRAVDPTRPALPAVAPHSVARPSPVLAAVSGGAAWAGGRVAADEQARRLAEDDRWRGVAVTRFDGEGPAVAWQPVCVLVRERGTEVPAGRPLARTLKLFNDTRSGTPITVHWLFRMKGRPTELRDKRVVKLPPGGSEEFPLTLPLPAGVLGDAELILSCEREGREVFRDVRALTLVGP